MTTSRELEPRHLGRGVYAHPLGVHCGPLDGRSDADALAGLRRAVEHDATLIDTADCHGNGHAERIVGRLLREHPHRQLLCGSKVGHVQGSAPHPYAGRNIHRQCAQTLENLYVNHLDLYVLDSLDFGEGDRYLGGAIEQMVSLREVGMVTAIGMCGPQPGAATSTADREAQAQRFSRLFTIMKPDVVWTRFDELTLAPILDGDDLFTYTARHHAGLVLAVTAEFLMSSAGKSIVLGLRARMQQTDHCVVVFDCSSRRRVDEWYRRFALPLTEAELRQASAIQAGIRAGRCPSDASRRITTP